MITAKLFEERMRRAPQDDDMERVNCEKAGELGHWGCGWCATHDLPQFQCGCCVQGHTTSHLAEINKILEESDGPN